MDLVGPCRVVVAPDGMVMIRSRFQFFTVPVMATVALLAVSCQHRAPEVSTETRPKETPVETKPPVETWVEGLAPGFTSHTLYHEGRQRQFLAYRPPLLKVGQPAPLLVALHGGGGTPENILEVSGFNQLADRHGFVVVYPAGSGSTPTRLFWNILLSGTYASANQVDDIGYLARVLDHVTGMTRIDSNRVYFAGFSQGGMMCFRLACDPVMSGRIAAIATVGATMTVAPSECHASHPVPAITFHGKKDPFSNYAGGIAEKAPRNDLVARPGFDESIRYWVKRWGLPETPSASGHSGTAHMQQFGPDAQGYEVVSWTFEDGGHTWPGSNANLPEWMMGKVNYDVDASALIWDFFMRHPRITQ